MANPICIARVGDEVFAINDVCSAIQMPPSLKVKSQILPHRMLAPRG
jgi:nitrite reductase/ring-hydroxylating ferredoxin subunit